MVSSRLNGRSARIVITSPPEAIYEGGAEGARPRDRLGADIHVREQEDRTQAHTKLAGCRAVRTPPVFAGLDVLSVVTVDMKRGLPSVDVDA